MSMKALDQLVARSITDPSIVQAYKQGSLEPILMDFDFAPQEMDHLLSVKAESWAEFAVQAFRAMQLVEAAQHTLQLPSPLEGLLGGGDARDEEQVA